MKKRIVLSIVTGLFLLPAHIQAAAQMPNVIIIMADDLERLRAELAEYMKIQKTDQSYAVIPFRAMNAP